MYQHVIRIGATFSIGGVQDKLHEVILHYTQNQHFLPTIHNLDDIYALSGLSESGKSSVIKAFCSHHRSAQAFQAKIVDFDDLMSECLGKSVYSLPEKEQAFRLLHELERFSNDHYWLRVIIVDSMLRHSVAEWHKTIRRKLQVIYIHTADVKSLERVLLPCEE